MKALHKAALLLTAHALYTPHNAQAVMIGDEVCITNYIMDQFCINLGTFLDDSSNMTLVSPEHHSFHCLLDVARCSESGYVVLTDKNEDTGMHCLGYRLDETEAVLAAGRIAGRKGYCTDCTGDDTKPTHGFMATVKGKVIELGDGSDGITGTPLLGSVQVLDNIVECESTAVAVQPVCMAPPEPEPVKIGDEVCITNYIMDQFCINLGTFLDDSSNMTLVGPEHHSFHCLLDVARCSESGYVVLTDKNEDTGMHCLGYRLDETEAVLAAGRIAGRKGYCTDCTGDDTKPTHGFMATVKGTVIELGDGSDGITGTPLLGSVQVLDNIVECESTAVAVQPVCMAPPEPETTTDGPPQSCPESLDQSTVIDAKATLYYAVVPSNPTGSGNGILCARLEVENDGWIALGFSEAGRMFGSDAVIGIPGVGSVLKYDLSSTALVMSDNKQTLRDTAIVQEEGGKTIMTFTKLLVEDGEIPISEEGVNTFLHSRGGSTLGYHSTRISFEVDFPATTADCTKEVCEEQLSADYLLRYQINVPADTTADVCDGCTISMELIYDGEAWIGIAFSTDRKMVGSEAVIGIPGDSRVLKYNLAAQSEAGVTPMPDSQQTLLDASCGVSDGQTIVKFTKIMKEPDEIEITMGENIFLWAYGSSNELGYHKTRDSVEVDLSGSEKVAVGDSFDVKVGDQICITNYIMDQFCINLGYLLDDQDTMTLVNPEEHSFHCLLDVPQCKNSGYVVLTDKDEETGMHCLGYRLDDTAAVLEAGLAAGQQGYCKDCTGDSTKPTKGYRATVKGTVQALGDGSDGITGTPILGSIEILDASEECETTIVNPVCMGNDLPALPAPTPPAKGSTKDCTKELCEQELSPVYLLKYQINVPTGTTVDVCDGCTISMELIYDEEAWVAIAFSTDGLMIGSEAVIGNPGDNSVMKYNLGAKSEAGVTPMPDSQQTLLDTSVEVSGGKTIVKFTKIMKESGEIEISTGDNNFPWAYGSATTLGYHKTRDSIILNLSSGSAEAIVPPNRSAWLIHGILAFLAWGVLVPFAVQSSLLRDFLPAGPLWFKLHKGFNSTAFAFFVVIFAIAMATTQKEGTEHFQIAHQKMGLAMFILASFQVSGGIFRPHQPDAGEEKTGTRKGWEVGHRVFGTALLACGFWQMAEGIMLYGNKYSVPESDSDKLTTAYWVWIGIMTALIVLGVVFKVRKGSLEDTNTTNHAPLPDDNAEEGNNDAEEGNNDAEGQSAKVY